jgi:hypothetical protein
MPGKKFPALNFRGTHMPAVQKQTPFFDFTDDRSMPHLPLPPSLEEIRMSLAPNNSRCPLNEILAGSANERHLRTLRRFALNAYRQLNHSCRGNSFGIYSLADQGKAFVVRKFAETVGLPFAHVQSKELASLEMLLQLMRDACDKAGTPLQYLDADPVRDYYLPPCIVFFEDAHQMQRSLLTGPLVGAMDMEDGYMPIRVGGKMQIVDCWEVCWIASTTDRRRIPAAFSKRLTTTIEWTPMDEETLTRIVRAGVKKTANSACGRDLPDSVCALIARYAKTPMRAVYDFTPKVFQQKRLMPSCSWAECCEIVAKDIRR